MVWKSMGGFDEGVADPQWLVDARGEGLVPRDADPEDAAMGTENTGARPLLALYAGNKVVGRVIQQTGGAAEVAGQVQRMIHAGELF